MDNLPLRLGLTMWSHSQWQGHFYGSGTKPAERLEKYAQVFHTVEGNTTFYATPSISTVNNWRSATPIDFKFTFKLPKTITHELLLSHSQHALTQFMTAMEPLHERVGQWTIQLPAAFSPEHLDRLITFCSLFPSSYPLGIEVRNMAFFNKGESEKRLNQWLIESKIDRIIMDSRPVFSAKPESEAVKEAHKNKPRVPVHAIATANHPMIRYIGHPDLNANTEFFSKWVPKIAQWIKQGKQPYLMVHTPDNVHAPELALALYKQLSQTINLPDISAFPANKGDSQIVMF